MTYIIIFILGLCIGSFINVLIYRTEQRADGKSSGSIIFGRSYCPYCHNHIRGYDNIPLLSFLFLRGKCRNCKQKISWQYPLVEVATGILFVAIFNFIRQPADLISNFQFADWVILAYLFVVFSGLFAILVYDLKHYIIPNKIVYPLIVFTLAFDVLKFLNLDLFRNLKLEIRNFQSLEYLLFSLLVPLFFLSLIIVSRGKWMGLGDVKLAVFMALFLGWPNVLVATILSFWLGTIVSIPLMIAGKKGLKSNIPFGPFLIIGTFIAFFWGDNIVRWYLGLSL